MNEIEKLNLKINELEKKIEDLTFQVSTLGDSKYKGNREYINHEIQFMRKCYNKNGTLITQINPT